MKRYILAAIAALALTPLAFAGDPTAAVVVVNCGRFGGSGVGVAAEDSHSLVVSNRHVTELATAPISVSTGGKSYPAVAVITHPDDDLALIVVKGQLPAVAALADDEPGEGEPVALYGYAWDAQGKLARKNGEAIPADGKFFQSTLAPVSGDSGGGVFDARGELVAVNHGFLGSYERRGPQVGVRLATLRAFVCARVADRFPRLAGKCAEPKKTDAKAAPKKAPCVCGDGCKCKPGECPNRCPAAKPAPKADVAPKLNPVAPPAPAYRVEYFQSRGRLYYRLVPAGGCAGGCCPLQK